MAGGKLVATVPLDHSSKFALLFTEMSFLAEQWIGRVLILHFTICIATYCAVGILYPITPTCILSCSLERTLQVWTQTLKHIKQYQTSPDPSELPLRVSLSFFLSVSPSPLLTQAQGELQASEACLNGAWGDEYLYWFSVSLLKAPLISLPCNLRSVYASFPSVSALMNDLV